MQSAKVLGTLRVIPNLTIGVRNVESGEVQTERVRNLVVDTGLNEIRDLLLGSTFRPSHVGVGDDNTAVAATDTTIVNEVYRGEITRRLSLDKTYRMQFFIPQGDANGNTLREVGLLQTGFQNTVPKDPATLLARATHSDIAKTSAVEISYTWDIILAAV